MSDKYALYIGDNIQTVSLWVRQNGKEYPIYANTRGQCEWYGFSTDEYENVHTETLSERAIEWLAHIHRVQNGLLDTDSESMYLAGRVKADRPEADPEAWYERELLNHIGEPSLTEEQAKLCEWGYNQVQENE